jgi:simple sugar transport system permease protein
MVMRIREALKTNEFFLFSIIVVMGIVFALFNPMFFSINNLFDILKSMVETGIFAMGSLLVLISGGIDLSFMAVAVFAMHSVTKFFGEYWGSASILTLFIAGAGIGTLLGMFNSLFIAKFKLASFIVTLGTGNIIKGFLLAFIGSKQINKLPQAMIEFSKSNLITIKTTGGNANLHAAVLVLAAVVILVSILLSKTMLGRKIYCAGGNPVSSERVGFNNGRILLFVYSFAGALAGLTGVIHTSFQRMSNPFDLVGGELNVIAAVVIGGPRIGGGYGNTAGTMLGVLLITLINNSLVMLKIPTFWQKAAIGFIIILGTVIQIYRYKRKQKVSP